MTTDKQYKYPRDVEPHDYETALIFIANLERQLAAEREKVRELSEDAGRYRAFRAAVSNGDFQGKEKQPWREAFEFWFSKFQPEDSLDAAIDNAIAGKNTFPTAKQAKAALEASLERICPTARKEKS